MAKETSRLNKSDGVTQLGPLIDSKTARSMVHTGEAVIQTAGKTGFDVIKLVSAAKDTKYTAATTSAPVPVAIDNVVFKPIQIPEPPGF